MFASYCYRICLKIGAVPSLRNNPPACQPSTSYVPSAAKRKRRMELRKQQQIIAAALADCKSMQSCYLSIIFLDVLRFQKFALHSLHILYGWT